MIRRTALALFCAAIVLPAANLSADAPKKKAKVLFVTQSNGFTHGSVRRRGGKLAPSEVAIIQLGQQTGLFEAHCTQDCAADFTPENLKKYDIVMFYTTGELPITAEAREYFLNTWLKTKGHGFIGFHSATDTYRSRKGDEKQNEKYRWYWGHDRRHLQRSPLELTQHRHDYRPRHEVPGDEAVRRGIPDQR